MTEYLFSFLSLLLPVGLVLGGIAGIFTMIATGTRNPDDTVTPNKKALMISLGVGILLAVLISGFLSWKKTVTVDSRSSALRTPHSVLYT